MVTWASRTVAASARCWLAAGRRAMRSSPARSAPAWRPSAAVRPAARARSGVPMGSAGGVSAAGASGVVTVVVAPAAGPAAATVVVDVRAGVPWWPLPAATITPTTAATTTAPARAATQRCRLRGRPVGGAAEGSIPRGVAPGWPAVAAGASPGNAPATTGNTLVAGPGPGTAEITCVGAARPSPDDGPDPRIEVVAAAGPHPPGGGTDARAAAIAAADAKRSAGSGAMALPITSARCGSASGRSTAGWEGRSWRMLYATASGVAPANGLRPVSASYITTPRA